MRGEAHNFNPVCRRQILTYKDGPRTERNHV